MPRKITDDEILKIANDLNTWMQQPTNFWLGDFAALHNINRNTLKRLSDRNEYLKEIYLKAKQLQENKIVKMGFSKSSNPAFAMFTLKNVAGWKDKKEVAMSGTLTNLLKEIYGENQGLVAKERNSSIPKATDRTGISRTLKGSTLEIGTSVLD